jgi:hypothetical protein
VADRVAALSDDDVAFLKELASSLKGQPRSRVRLPQDPESPLLLFYGQFETVPITDVSKGPLSGANRWIIPRRGPAHDDITQICNAVECDYIWGSVGEGNNPWLEVWDNYGKKYVYVLDCALPVEV